MQPEDKRNYRFFIGRTSKLKEKLKQGQFSLILNTSIINLLEPIYTIPPSQVIISTYQCLPKLFLFFSSHRLRQAKQKYHGGGMILRSSLSPRFLPQKFSGKSETRPSRVESSRAHLTYCVFPARNLGTWMPSRSRRTCPPLPANFHPP